MYNIVTNNTLYLSEYCKMVNLLKMFIRKKKFIKETGFQKKAANALSIV